MFSYTEVVWDRYTDVRRILRFMDLSHSDGKKRSRHYSER